MGKTPTPLTIWVASVLRDDPVWDTLRDQGHTIQFEQGGYDICFGPRCWRLLPHQTKYLTIALKEARAARKVKTPKEA